MYSTDYLMDPQEDLIIIIYTNAEPFANPDINLRFRILVYQALVGEK
jgi:CubicO group peptidase (beta-lactamase class C family)